MIRSAIRWLMVIWSVLVFGFLLMTGVSVAGWIIGFVVWTFGLLPLGLISVIARR